jgi:hypothetical protein
MTQDITAPHAAVMDLTRRVEGQGHKLYMDSFFSSPDLFENLTKKKINYCETVRPNRKGMPQDLGREILRLKRGEIQVRTRGDLTALIWKDKRDVHMLTNMHNPSAEGNCCDKNGNAQKPAIVEDYNRHMCFVGREDRMPNSYTISHHM